MCDHNKGKGLTTRNQFPLKVAYALTIYYSYSRTLQRINVNCSCVGNAGKFGVAV